MEKGEVLAEYDAADNETLLLTVPDENGWDLYINGKKSTKYQAENTFIAVPVSKGHNTIQLRYVQVFFPVFWLLDFFPSCHCHETEKNIDI